MESELIVGPRKLADGAKFTQRGEGTGGTVVQDAHGRFQEAALRGNLYSAGMALTAITNATFTTGTLGATCTPIVGLWNPMGSGRNLIILQVKLQLINTAATTTGPGALVYATAVAQSAISTGIVPLSRLSLVAAGSVAKGFANTALTGLSGNLTVQEASALTTFLPNYSFVQTAAGTIAASPCSVDNIDGSIVLVPGSVLALLGSTTPVAVSAASSILWEEQAI